MVPTREIFWNVGELRTTVYLVALLSILIAIYGVARHYKRWSLGKKESGFAQPISRLKYLARFIFGHGTILRESYPGVMHLLIFWGFFILFLGTLTIAFQEDILYPFFDKRILQGRFYLFYAFILDIFGLLAILGTLMALLRRYAYRPKELDNQPSDLIVLWFILLVLTTGFLVEGLRIRVSHVPWEHWEPVGRLFGIILNAFSMTEITQVSLHKVLWWVHLMASLGLIAYFPFSKLFHIVSSSLNVFFRSVKPPGCLTPLEFQNAESFGVGHVRDFTWKQLLDSDACMNCGRCDRSCPAYLSDQPLSPKGIVRRIGVLMKSAYSPGPPEGGREDYVLDSDGTIGGEDIWSCTSCLACVQRCPVLVDHLDKIMDIRQYAVLKESRFPSEYKRIFNNVEVFGDPLAKGKLSREEWASNLKVKRISQQDADFDFLFWAGCIGALYDETNRSRTIAAAEILEKAEVDFAILGKMELCCGDTVRRMGNEYLFQRLANENIRLFERFGVKKIVTSCPHCFHVFRNEYTHLGAELEVLHFTELTKSLLREGRLNVKSKVDGLFTYHDPCYLGRYNSIYQPPREILGSVLLSDIKEMANSNERGFCCGAGGGGFWRGRKVGRRMEETRIDEAIKTRAEGVISACPFCEITLDSAAKEKGVEGAFKVMDLIELVRQLT